MDTGGVRKFPKVGTSACFGNNFKFLALTRLQELGNLNGIALRNTGAAIGAITDTAVLQSSA